MPFKFYEHRFILGKFAFCTRGSLKHSARCMLLKVGENRFFLAETMNIFQNSRWRPPPSRILENLLFCTWWSLKPSARCTPLKFGENRFILVETINIFQNPSWRRPPSWILKKLIVSARVMRFSPTFNSTHLATPGTKNQIFHNSRSRMPSWIFKTFNCFRKDEGFLTTFQRSTQSSWILKER